MKDVDLINAILLWRTRHMNTAQIARELRVDESEIWAKLDCFHPNENLGAHFAEASRVMKDISCAKKS